MMKVALGFPLEHNKFSEIVQDEAAVPNHSCAAQCT